MDWTKFKSAFDESWHPKMKPFIESDECDKIYAFLKKESKRGKNIAPLSTDTFRCFRETKFDDLKLIIVGLSPYHTFRTGKPVADGLALSCGVTKILQPSLEKFYEALETEFYKGLNLNYYKNYDLSYLAKQGVLLLNRALTVEKYKPESHVQIWEPFMQYLFEQVFDTTGVPVLFLGKVAAKLKKYVTPFTWTFELPHPASASYTKGDWETGHTFRNINQLLISRNGFDINWLGVEKKKPPIEDNSTDDDIPF